MIFRWPIWFTLFKRIFHIIILFFILRFLWSFVILRRTLCSLLMPRLCSSDQLHVSQIFYIIIKYCFFSLQFCFFLLWKLWWSIWWDWGRWTILIIVISIWLHVRISSRWRIRVNVMVRFCLRRILAKVILTILVASPRRRWVHIVIVMLLIISRFLIVVSWLLIHLLLLIRNWLMLSVTHI